MQKPVLFIFRTHQIFFFPKRIFLPGYVLSTRILKSVFIPPVWHLKEQRGSQIKEENLTTENALLCTVDTKEV